MNKLIILYNSLIVLGFVMIYFVPQPGLIR